MRSVYALLAIILCASWIGAIDPYYIDVAKGKNNSTVAKSAYGSNSVLTATATPISNAGLWAMFTAQPVCIISNANDSILSLVVTGLDAAYNTTTVKCTTEADATTLVSRFNWVRVLDISVDGVGSFDSTSYFAACTMGTTVSYDTSIDTSWNKDFFYKAYSEFANIPDTLYKPHRKYLYYDVMVTRLDTGAVDTVTTDSVYTFLQDKIYFVVDSGAVEDTTVSGYDTTWAFNTRDSVYNDGTPDTTFVNTDSVITVDSLYLIIVNTADFPYEYSYKDSFSQYDSTITSSSAYGITATGDTIAQIDAGSNRLEAAAYTVPWKKKGLITSWSGSCDAPDSVGTFELRVRDFGEAWRVVDRVTLQKQDEFSRDFAIPIYVGSKADIVIYGSAAAANSATSSARFTWYEYNR